MIVIEEQLNQIIDQKLLEKNKENKHVASGKLSASRLGWPLQWQILHYLAGKNPDKLLSKEHDAYTLRKFERGKDVEEKILGFFEGEKQKPCEYKGAGGIIDLTFDVKDCGVIPVELKSVMASKWLRIKKQGFQRDHALQGAFYALAEGTDNFGVMYVNADDYQSKLFVLDASDYQREIEDNINSFNKAIKERKIPVFKAKEVWQDNLKYNSFSEFYVMTEEELVDLSAQYNWD